ncbi:HAD-IA family hydrolase [Pantoea sp. B65]|uniref:HAD-IA family hydrolase n=1 Tax=Pantoea sp. B65 TaxID=2813359 RepID=UPI0039B4D6EF
MQFSALLFDLDGTLVDSLDRVEQSWQQWAQARGLNASEVIAFLHGKPAIATFRHFMPQASAGEIEQEFLRLEAYEARSAQGIAAVDGAGEFLQQVQSLAIPWAVVTSGSRKVATARIRAAKLPAPPILITSENVLTGKPHPQPFLLAAEALGVAAAACIAFEDSLAGLTAAQSASCQVIELRTTKSVEHHVDCILTLDNYRNIWPAISENNFYLNGSAKN